MLVIDIIDTDKLPQVDLPEKRPLYCNKAEVGRAGSFLSGWTALTVLIGLFP